MHDVGSYGQDKQRILEIGMVITVEPGIYISEDADVPEQYQRHWCAHWGQFTDD